MVSGLLLIALIFFVFAQAAFTRSGGQSAADAAALAAVREARDQLYDRPPRPAMRRPSWPTATMPT
jgi:hypothetical protein